MEENEKKEYLLHINEKREIADSFLEGILKSFFSLSLLQPYKQNFLVTSAVYDGIKPLPHIIRYKYKKQF